MLLPWAMCLYRISLSYVHMHHRAYPSLIAPGRQLLRPRRRGSLDNAQSIANVYSLMSRPRAVRVPPWSYKILFRGHRAGHHGAREFGVCVGLECWEANVLNAYQVQNVPRPTTAARSASLQVHSSNIDNETAHAAKPLFCGETSVFVFF